MKKSLLTIVFIRLIEQLLFFIGLVLMQVYVNKSISMYLVKGAWWDACEVLTLRLVFTEFIHIPILLSFFSTDELLVSEHALTFSHSKREKISVDHIDRMEVFMKERTFRSPIDLIIHFERDYVVIRFDKFNFKNPKKEFLRFQQLLPEGVKRKMVERESAYFDVELIRLGKQATSHPTNKP
jgi:hypothetical protein